MLVLAGCGSSGTSVGPTTSAPPTRDARCKNVPAPVAKEIAAKVAGGTLQSAQAVQSLDYETPTYFVSAKLASGETGTWATNKLKPTGSIYAVDDIAKKDSTWPHGDTSDTYVNMNDDGADLSRDCVAAVAK